MDHDSSAYRDITPPTYARPSPVQTLSSSQTIEVEIGGKHHYVHSSDSILHEELATAVSSTQHQFMDQDNPFLTQPAKTTMQDSSPASYRQRERRSVAQIARAFEEDDDNPFLISNKPIATKKRPYVVQEERSYSDITTAPTASTAPSQGSSSSTYIDSSRPSEPTAKTPPPQPRHFQSRTSKSKRSGDTLDYSSVTVEDLKRSRKELKAWEANFKNTHQRTATQDDITKDEAMVRKYRTYAKIKKALAAKEEKEQKEPKEREVIVKPPAEAVGFTDLSSGSSSIPRTPTKQYRTHHASAVTRTPTGTPGRNHEVEFVSPRTVVNGAGMMSPSRINRNGEDRHQFLASAGSTTPKGQRTRHSLLSPSMGAARRSLLSSPSFKSPTSSLFVINEQMKESMQAMAQELVAESHSPTIHITQRDDDLLHRPTTPSQLLRTPSKKISSLYLPNPLQSPSRSRTSPAFGGMNNRRIRRPIRSTTAPVAQDLEPSSGGTLQLANASLTPGNTDLAPDVLFMTSPLLSTPHKSGAAKMARSLFRRSSVSHPSSPSIRRPTLDLQSSHAAYANQHSPTLHRREDEYKDSAIEPVNPFNISSGRSPILKAGLHQNSVHEAMDTMSIADDRESNRDSSLLDGCMVQGFDLHDPWEDANGSQQRQQESLRRTPLANMAFPSSGSSPGSMTPSGRRSMFLTSTPRTPSQQPSLTFSQTTPGSAKSDISTFVVPPGFHSHYRRRQVRSTLFMPSQEDDEQFEREFLGQKQKKQSGDAFRIPPANHQSVKDTIIIDSGGGALVGELDPMDENNWEDQENEAEDDQQTDPFGPVRKPLPKKKYTQKRSTRLHRIAVAPSEKVEAARPVKTPRKRRPVKTDELESTTNQNKNEPAVNQEENSNTTEAPAVSANEPGVSGITSKAKPSNTEESVPFGWANSNRPMVKSDRRAPGVGQGRAGPKRAVPSKYGGSGSDGNFVAYNLQRGGFRKGGARGRPRFGGSKFGSYGAGGPGSGRTLFDNESWRTEFDNDFNDATLAMNIVDGDMEIEGDDDHLGDMPWYGNVNDITDPYVVTVSSRYLKAQVGDVDDPEEYVKALELQSHGDSNDAGWGEETEAVRVNLEHILKKVWGYPSFRDGQLDSIKRALNYKSSLLVLPTGSGKSLSYQLPAYIFSKLGIPSLTLVISPMISLMYDQVRCLPPGLIGACWTSVEQSASQFKDFMEKLTSNTIKILFISPEKLQSQSFLSLIRARRIPRISFFCVDEVHCLSEWSHNFRPAYLLLNHVLKTDLKSPCVLGLTGTATEGTKDSICAMLDIDRATGVLSGPVIRENLAMTVSLETDRETALLHLLQSPRFASMGSILIYVMKQIQADALAAFLRVRNFSTESYHAGKSSQDRQRIQQRFMNEGPQKGVIAGGTLGSNTASGASPSGIRILVATIAFGLGLNKSNIRSVIHYCMPKSLENYVQEIGRSGRDGEKAYCHMFLNQDDYLRLRSLAYADGMDWGTVLRLVKKLFSRKGIADPLSMQSGKGSSTKAVSKKRRGIGNKGADGNRPGNDENGSEDGALSPGAKKRKQNDRQPLSVKMGKAGNKAESKQQSLILSTASILVIPPAAGMVLPDKSNVLHPRRVVVVREELAEEEFDIKKEVLATLLSYIELDPSRPIKVVGSISAKCTVKFLQTSEALSELADKIPLVDIILKQGVLTGHNSNSGSSYGKGRRGNMTGLAGTTLSMAYCCDTMSLCQQSDMNYSELLQELQLWKRKKWAVFEMTDPGLCVEILKEAGDCMVEYRQQKREQQRREAQRRRKGHRRSGPDMDMDVDEAQGRYSISPTGSEDEQERDANAYEKDHDDFIVALADRLYQKLCAVERVGVAKVDQVYTLFQSVATPTWQQQEVYRPKIQDIGNDDQNEEASEDANEGDESSEYDEDVDPEYIQMRARMKARARSSQNGVSKSEIILRQGIQDYFAKHSGEGIGGPSAAEDFFSHIKDSTTTLSSVADKTMRLYSYENAIVTNLQRKWKSAVEVDLKVFLSQQWQLQQQQNQTMSEYGGAAGKTNELSPRAVSRIFHGISSPCYPALEWSRHRYWAKYVHFDFAQLMQMADRITKEQRQQRLVSQQRRDE